MEGTNKERTMNDDDPVETRHFKFILNYISNEEEKRNYLDYAVKKKVGIYSAEPEVPLDEAQLEIERAKEEFGRVVAEEEKRVQDVVDKENERVMGLLREKERISTCPFCLEDMLEIYHPSTGPIQFDCCGARLCKDCSRQWLATSKNLKCFTCRGDLYNTSNKNLAKNGGVTGRGYALEEIAGELCGKGKYEQAFDYYHQAADLENGGACGALAHVYHGGIFFNLDIEKSVEKAVEYAHRGSDQGNHICNVFLGLHYRNVGDVPKYLHYMSIASHQGSKSAKTELVTFFLRHEGRIPFAKQRALYWCGRRLEDKGAEDSYYFYFFTILDELMRVRWHRRTNFDIESFTGCNHLPLWNSLNKVRECKEIKNKNSKILETFINLKCSIWKDICAQCGNPAKEQLKMCARCKSFHYCSKECQVKHWKAEHKVDYKGH